MEEQTYTDAMFLDALKKEQAYRLSEHSDRIPWRMIRAWMYYEGPEIPFTKIYFRWHPDRVVLAAIDSDDYEGSPVHHGGRLPVVFDALEQLYDDIRIESVNAPHMRTWLSKRGYEAIPVPGIPEAEDHFGDMKRPSVDHENDRAAAPGAPTP